jgi:bacteriophage N4 adsorption protein B
LLLAAYGAAILWSQLWLAEKLGAPIKARLDPRLVLLLTINGYLLLWRMLMRAWFTAAAYGWRQGVLSVPRLIIGNVIAMLAAGRAVSLHFGGGAKRWDKTRHIFPAELPQ